MRVTKKMTGLLAGLVAVVALAGSASAQQFPTKEITIVVPFAAGGPADVIARIMGEQISASLGRPVIVENRTGAGGSIGANVVANAAPDGHTLLLMAAGHTGMSALYPKLNFDPVADFRPVIGLASSPIVIAVKADSKYKTIQELVADAKARPGVLTCAGGGGGATLPNVSFEVFKAELGLKIEAVSYRGSAPAQAALIGGELDCAFDALAAALPGVKGGRTRMLASTTNRRSPLVPEVPTVAETVLPNFNASVWFGILAPAKTPDAIVDRLSQAFAKGLKEPKVIERFGVLAADPMDADQKEFGRFIASETERWTAVIKRLDLKPE